MIFNLVFRKTQLKMNNNKLGNLGENIACKFLISNGYRVVKRNYKIGFDEIDIIAVDVDETLVFVEVKTGKVIKARNAFTPEDHMNSSKLKKIARLCQKFCGRHPSFINDEKGWRIDLIAIVLDIPRGGTLRHYKNL